RPHHRAPRMILKDFIQNDWSADSLPPKPPLVRTDLNAFLLSNDKEFRTFLGPSINLRYSLASSTPEIEANAEELKRLIGIFLSNAKKAMVHGGQLLLQTKDVSLADPDTTVPSGAPGSYLMLAISDSGNGIHAEAQSRIQQLFSGRWRPKGGY